MFLTENIDDMISVEPRTFCEGVDGLFEIALESEMSWNNIVNQAMRTEFSAIKNEDAQLLNEGVKDFFMKIIEWIKEKVKAVGQFFANLIRRISVQVQNVEGFARKHSRELANVKSNVTVEIYTWRDKAASKGAVGITEDSIQIIKKLESKSEEAAARAKHTSDSALNANVISQELIGIQFNEISSKLTSKYRTDKKEEKMCTPNEISVFAKNLLNYKDCIAGIKENEKQINKNLKEIENNAKQAVSDAKKLETGRDEAVESAVEAKKQNIMLKKELGSIYDRVVGTSISLCTQYVLDAVKACKKAIKPSKEEDKKNESYTLFDMI